jgi:hypothetical protein
VRTDDPRACRWCGDPLPDRVAGQRGRPRVVHAGICTRLMRNRQKLDARCALFRAAHRPDRSDVVLAAPDGYAIDAGDLDEGWSVDRGWDDRPVAPGLLEAWEADQRLQRRVDEHERQEIRVEIDAALDAFDALPSGEQADWIRAAVARRRAR